MLAMSFLRRLVSASRAFNNHQLRFLREGPITLDRNVEKCALVPSVCAGIECTGHLATDNQLRSRVALGLQQHRIHVNGWPNAARLRLQCLCSTDLSTTGCDGGIVRHVLRLEGPHGNTTVCK
jgi:hypothetical protein